MTLWGHRQSSRTPWKSHQITICNNEGNRGDSLSLPQMTSRMIVQIPSWGPLHKHAQPTSALPSTFPTVFFSILLQLFLQQAPSPLSPLGSRPNPCTNWWNPALSRHSNRPAWPSGWSTNVSRKLKKLPSPCNVQLGFSMIQQILSPLCFPRRNDANRGALA